MLALLLAWLFVAPAQAQDTAPPAAPDQVVVGQACLYDAATSVYDTVCVYQ